MSKKSTEYKAVCNYFRNTEGIDRLFIKTLLTEITENVVKDELKRLFETNWFKDIILNCMQKRSGNYYSSLQKEVEQAISRAITEVAQQQFKNQFILKFEQKEVIPDNQSTS